MNRFHPFLLAALVLMVGACDAQDEILSANLFDENASGPRDLKDDTSIRNGTYVLDRSVLFYDTGGLGGNYRNNENIVMVIQPKDATDRVVFDLYQFESEFTGGSTCTEDYLTVYNGVGTSAPRLDQWCGSFNSFFLPWRFVATNVAGALTIAWRSDASINYSGFYGQLSLLRTSQTYSVSGLRTTSFGGNAFRAIYETVGPPTLMQNHGLCYSTSLTTPSRTNGATCGTANANRYGTTQWNISGATAFMTVFVRAYLTQPNGTIMYSGTSSVVPTAKAMPDFTGYTGLPNQGEILIGSDF